MGKLTILGNANPVIGQKEMYSVSLVNDDWLNPLGNTYKNPLQAPKTHWEVMVQTKTGWRKGGSNKEGQTVPYTFEQKSLMHKGIKIVVQQGEDKGELIVYPQRAKEPKITKVELLDANYKPIPKGKKLSYRDTVIARAYCVEMFKMQVAFTLWEDDAKGEGHDPITNALNKINLIPVLGTVDIGGIAEVVFRLPSYTMAVLIANMRIASGDKNEGATHEYYVTADVVSKNIQKASANVNVTNPTYNPEPPKRQRTLPQNTPPPKPKPPAEKPKPKPDSSKFPVTTGGKSQSDGQGKILSAEFVDKNGSKLHSSKVGTTVFLKITAKNMKNKKVKVKIWEEDNFTWTNDLIFEKDYVLVGDANFVWVQLTKKMFDKASDGSDSSRQDYFIEVIHNETSVTSEVMPVSADAEPTKVETGISASSVGKPKQEKTSTSCICKEQYKDLIWGGKVSCEFRNKVVQICSELWGESRKMEMANGLMAVINVETAGSFKAHQIMGKPLEDINSVTKDDFWLIKKDKKTGKELSRSSRAVGLIQFTQPALQAIGEFTARSGFDKLHEVKLRFAKMGEVKQLDYVKKYFEKSKGRIKTPEDIYLQVFAPEGVGKSNDYVLYNKETSGEKYKQNESIDKENDHDGKIQRREILGRYNISFNKGKNNKTSEFICKINDKTETNSVAKDIITYHIYSGGKIEKHIPKIKSGYEQKYKYVYHDKNNAEHELGIFNFKTTTQIAPGNKIGTGEIQLIDIREFKGYNSNGIKLKFKTLNTDSGRYYINPNCYAGLLGAMADMNIDYLGYNGFSNYEGKSTGGSKSHRNGEKGDLRYISKNKMGEATILQDKHFDVTNQNKFNDILFSFGWGRLEKMYSEYFTYNGNKNYLLNHTKHMRRDGKNGYRHYHHLHLSGFDHSLIKIINEK
jgi:hypothetical protein